MYEVRADLVRKSDKQAVEYIDKALKGILEYTNSERIAKAQETMSNATKQRINRMRNELEMTKKKWELRIEDLKKENQRAMDRIEAQMEIAVRKFEETNENMLKVPYKPSLNIIELRRNVARFKDTGRDYEYDQQKKILIDTEKHEREEHKRKLLSEYNAKKQNIIKRYKHRLIEREIFFNHTLERLVSESDAEVSRLEKNISFIQLRDENSTSSLSLVSSRLKQSRSAEVFNLQGFITLPQEEEPEKNPILDRKPYNFSMEARIRNFTPRPLTMSRSRLATPRSPKPTHPPLSQRQQEFVQRRNYNNLLYTRSARMSVRQ